MRIKTAVIFLLPLLATAVTASHANADTPPAASAVTKRATVGPNPSYCPTCLINPAISTRKAFGPGESSCPICKTSGNAVAHRKAVGPGTVVCPTCRTGNAIVSRKMVGPRATICPNCVTSPGAIANRKTFGTGQSRSLTTPTAGSTSAATCPATATPIDLNRSM